MQNDMLHGGTSEGSWVRVGAQNSQVQGLYLGGGQGLAGEGQALGWGGNNAETAAARPGEHTAGTPGAPGVHTDPNTPSFQVAE